MSFVPPITGATDVYLILGDPVEQVLAPETFNPIFAAAGIDAVLVPVQVSAENLCAFVKTALMAKNIKGMWVTIPHKSTVMAALDHCSERSRMAGAVNAIRRNADGSLEGELLDGAGFVASLRYFCIGYSGRRILILGAGGAAAAIAAALAHATDALCASEIAIYDPMPGKAAVLAQRIAAATGVRVYAAQSSDPSGFDLVINASPLGLRDSDPLPCDVSRMEAHASLLDIVMKNQPTPVLRAVRARGLQAQPGFEMLIQQAHLYLDFFGFSDAAEKVRQDASALRQKIYPHSMQHEMHAANRSARHSPGLAFS